MRIACRGRFVAMALGWAATTTAWELATPAFAQGDASAAPAAAASGTALNRHPHGSTAPPVPELSPAPDSTGGAPVRAEASTAVAEPPQQYLFSLHDSTVSTTGRDLADQGIYVTGWNIAEWSGVTAGGLAHGSFGTNWALLGTDLDMARIAGIGGAQIHLVANDIAGQGDTEPYNGAEWSFLSNWGNHDGLQLRELTWDQALLHDRLFLLAGRLNPKGGEFEGSEIYCQFATFLCSTPTTFDIDGGEPSFVTSSWGVRVLAKPSAATYVKAGAWEVEPWIRTNDHDSWPGPDWDPRRSAGVFVPVEAGYHSDPSTAHYPTRVAIGFTADTSRYDDPILDTAGLDRPLFGGAARSRRGRTTIYVQGQQVIWKPEQHGARGMTVFGAANFSTSGEGTARDGFVAGLFETGPFPTRPRDTAGLAFQTFLWNRSVVRAMNETLARNGDPDQWSGAETLMEANYGFNVAPGVKVTPYFEYIWNPDQLAGTVRPGIDHAVESGVMLDVELNPALGLPELHRIRN